MFSALKKLARGGDDRSPGAAPARMPSSLQKKFSRGVHYNMKILIKGDRNVGKSCLLQRLQGGPFIEEYVPTDQIQAAAIHWTYKNTDHIVKVEVWEVVDKARSKKKAPLGLKLDNAGAGGGAEVGDDEPALDATFLDVYKNANGVILMMDITKPWTFEYVVKELSSVPADLPLVLLGNHCDMQHHRQVHPHHLEQALQQARHTRTAPVRYAESSMRNGFGLRLLHKFLNIPFLRLQRTSLLQQLQRNQQDTQEAEQQLDSFQGSEESNYVLFVERLASKRRAGAGAAPACGDRSPSIVLGAGRPIVPPATNPLMGSTLSPLDVTPPPPPAQTQYVSPELQVATQMAALGSPASQSRDSASWGGGGVAGELDEFYAGVLDTSFLDDAAPPAISAAAPAPHDTDSDNDSASNPMVASCQDDLDDSHYVASPFASSSAAAGGSEQRRAQAQRSQSERRGSLEIDQLMSAVSVSGGGGGGGGGEGAGDMGSEFELWAGAARRSPEGGEDPDMAAEPVKEEKKHKKSKKSKDKCKEEGGDGTQRRERHKHKRAKGERQSERPHPQQSLLLPPGADQYDSF